MKSIPGMFQHTLVVADRREVADRRVVRKTCAERRKTCAERRKISLLTDKTRKRLEEKVIELVIINVPNLWGHSKDGDLKA